MRLLVFDQTCTAGKGGNLTRAWSAGAKLYRGMRRLDDTRGVASWDEALDWLANQQEPISQIQYWGHGKWGCALVDSDVFGASRLGDKRLDAIRERLTPDALLWFRTCETFGARAGLDFAERLSDRLGCRVAGHTYVIGFHQSGLHGLTPGTRPHWSADEGLQDGTAEAPVRAKWSVPWAPRTITCLSSNVPERWFSQ